MSETVILILGYVMIFLFGIVIGSFLNVCIYRQPKDESILKGSHCMTCGYELRWYDLIPLLSFLMLKGRCRKCGTKLSLQYPLVEGINGILYVIIFLANGWNIMSILYSFLTSALIVLSVIDWRTYTIPNKINLIILVLAVIATVVDYKDWKTHIIGFFSVGGFLLLLYLITVGRAMGGGDVKLMACAGLMLGWGPIIIAFLTGCIGGSVIHLIRMKISGEGHRLAMGPYLSGGIYISILFGKHIMDWYLSMSGLI